MLLDAGSEVRLHGLELLVTNSAVSKLAFCKGSHLSLKACGGIVPLNGSSYVGIQAGQLEATFSKAEWELGKTPNVAGDIEKLDLKLSGGRLMLQDQVAIPGLPGEKPKRMVSVANIKTGQIKGSNLALDSSARICLTGKLAEAAFELETGTSISVGGELDMTLDQGSKLEAKNGLRLVAEKNYPVGKVVFDLAIKSFATAKKDFALSSGKAHIPLMVDEDGVLSSPYVKRTDGTVAVDMSDRFNVSGLLAARSTEGELTARVNIEEGQFLPGRTMSAIWSVNLTGFSFKTRYPKTVIFGTKRENSEDRRFYPINVEIGLDGEQGFSRQPIEFKGGKMFTDTSFGLKFILHMPKGKGEYNDWNDPGKGTFQGHGERIDNSQEAVRDQFHQPFACTFHVYVIERTYHCTADARLHNTDKGLVLSMSGLDLHDAFKDDEAWCKDGCVIADAIVSLIVRDVGGMIRSTVLENLSKASFEVVVQ